MYSVRVVENHEAGTFTTNSIKRHKQVINWQKASSLVVEFVNTTKCEDLRMDLVNKKLY